MRFATILVLGFVASICAGCAAAPLDKKPPSILSYGEWGARLGEIGEIARAGELCEAGLGHCRNAHKTSNRDVIIEELTTAINLFKESADQLYLAWEEYPEYEDFILMELDKVYVYLHETIARRPYFFAPESTGEEYGTSASHDQKQAMLQYQKALKRWLKTLPAWGR